MIPFPKMSLLPEKLALRRMLQNFMYRLDETIVELMAAESDEPGIAPPCRFADHHLVQWNEHQCTFTPNTYQLLKQFFGVPNQMLSKEDVRQDVLFDTEAREGSVRQCISEARKEIRRNNFPYRIETITRKGYRLVFET